MSDAPPSTTLSPTTGECAICQREVLIGEPLTPYQDPRREGPQAVCGLCREQAIGRGWKLAGASFRRRGSTRLRVEPAEPGEGDTGARVLELAPALDAAPAADAEPRLTPPQAAILERAIGLEAHVIHDRPVEELLAQVRTQQLELERMRRELNPARAAEERRAYERQSAELREVRSLLQQRDQQIERLQRARHAETSPMRMSGYALDAFNQSQELERMARIARTLGDPIVNVHDEGAGIPRRVRITLAWDIAWYEFVVKLDLGAGAASVHETGTGGDPGVLQLERRRANAQWSGSGLKLT